MRKGEIMRNWERETEFERVWESLETPRKWKKEIFLRKCERERINDENNRLKFMLWTEREMIHRGGEREVIE